MFTDYIVNLEHINPMHILFMDRLLAITIFLVLSFGSFAQSNDQKTSEELAYVAAEYQLSAHQKEQARKLIFKRDEDLKQISTNSNLDEPQRRLKRSSIVKGYEGSLQLILNPDQRTIAHQKRIEKRKQRMAMIEELKKKGYTRSEILKQLDNKKSH